MLGLANEQHCCSNIVTKLGWLWWMEKCWLTIPLMVPVGFHPQRYPIVPCSAPIRPCCHWCPRFFNAEQLHVLPNWMWHYRLVHCRYCVQVEAYRKGLLRRFRCESRRSRRCRTLHVEIRYVHLCLLHHHVWPPRIGMFDPHGMRI